MLYTKLNLSTFPRCSTSSPKESSLTLINNELSGVFFIIKCYYNVLNLTFIFSPCCNTVGYPDCKTTHMFMKNGEISKKPSAHDPQLFFERSNYKIWEPKSAASGFFLDFPLITITVYCRPNVKQQVTSNTYLLLMVPV